MAGRAVQADGRRAGSRRWQQVEDHLLAEPPPCQGTGHAPESKQQQRRATSEAAVALAAGLRLAIQAVESFSCSPLYFISGYPHNIY
jgi:hypothetical protein